LFETVDLLILGPVFKVSVLAEADHLVFAHDAILCVHTIIPVVGLFLPKLIILFQNIAM